MQIEIHRTNSTFFATLDCFAQVFADIATDALKSLRRYVARWRRACPHRRHKRPAIFKRSLNEAADGNVHIRKRIDQGLPTSVGRKSISCMKGSPVRQRGRKGVGFVLVASDKNTHRTMWRNV